MIKNYFKTAWRNLWKNRFYTSINILGLAIGLAVGLVILLWVKDELSYDKFHSGQQHIYRVVANIGTGSSRQSWGEVPAPMGHFGRTQIPEVKNAVRIVNNDEYSMYKAGDKQFNSVRSAFIDSTFFTLFDFKVITGNPLKPFPDINSILVTTSAAKKYFGNEDPIGKVIVADDKDNYTVRGVIADFPENSSLKFDILFSIDLVARGYSQNNFWKSMNGDWGNYYALTFLQVGPGASLSSVEKKLTRILRDHNESATDNTFTLQPIANLHLYAPDGSSSAMQMVKLFIGVAILLLVIACINYVNLSTARSLLRAKEVSVRKIIGAARGQLFLQFIVETIILFLIATIIAIGIIQLIMPLYNSIAGKHNVFTLRDAGVWTTILYTIVGTLIASSIYPALLLSSFKPILALKGKISASVGSGSFRKVLVVTQFVFSVVLIIGTLVIGKQLRYLQEKDLGYDKTHLFAFNMRGIRDHYEAAKTELQKQPGITAVTAAQSNIVNIRSTTGDTDWDGKEANRSFLIHPLAIEKDFFSVMKLHLSEGSGFTGSPADSVHFILNETAVREAGITDPIGKSFTLWNIKGIIIGVAKDFHFTSLKTKIEPAIFYYKPSNQFTMYVKTTGRDAQKAIASAEKIWKEYNGKFPFEYTFLDETYDRMYKAEDRTSKLFNVFAGIAIFISCLGLFGLATYTAQIKTREIGIRKVLGATVASVTTLLAKDFLKLVLVAIIIASPLAWWLMNYWLHDFAYRTQISAWIFIVSGISCLLIALATVSAQAIRAALANPIDSLKTE